MRSADKSPDNILTAERDHRSSRETAVAQRLPAQAMSNWPAIDAATSPERPSDLSNMPLLIPVPRAAKLLGISRSAAYRCAASGDLPTAHLGGRVYVVTARLQSLLESA